MSWYLAGKGLKFDGFNFISRKAYFWKVHFWNCVLQFPPRQWSVLMKVHQHKPGSDNSSWRMGVAVSHQNKTLQHQHPWLCINSFLESNSVLSALQSHEPSHVSLEVPDMKCCSSCTVSHSQSFPGQCIPCTPEHCTRQPGSSVHSGLLKPLEVILEETFPTTPCI